MGFPGSSSLRNQRGQSAIFVALMFNVLFVFFAMAINVAMVVHDKINLQNSVDMGVYYAAEKQAELLNVIAHQNYMIRQSWKLLSWRYRVLGTMGLDTHPVSNNEISDVSYGPAATPSLCMNDGTTWEEVAELSSGDPDSIQNLCREQKTAIPPLPKVKVIAGFLGINHGIAALAEQLRTQYAKDCDNNGAFNWWFSASILHAFRIDQHNRKRVMYGVAQGLSRHQNDFVDLDGNSVLEGVRQTILKNLTFANREKGVDIQLFNSLGGVPYQSWLSEVQIAPTIVYTDIEDREGCYGYPQTVQNLPARQSAREAVMGGLSGGDLIPWFNPSSDGILPGDFQYSMGVEKNPWVMAYVGVKVQTNPRQVFFPVAGNLPTVARAFAKPFGGRIGPWYKDKWDRGSQESSGQVVDALLPPRVSVTNLNGSEDTRRLPNYSRYPGDTLGMTSKMSQNSLAGLNTLKARYDYYRNIKADFSVGGVNDILAWDSVSNKSPQIREFELAAIAPDLFDITYYSIEPNFSENYLARLKANKVRLGIPADAPVRSDLGSNSNIIPAFSIQNQMALVANRQRSEPYYFVRDKAHLLTSWVPGPGTYNYDASAAVPFFGNCKVTDDGFKVKNPGSCVAGGGRTGYSVKLVSRDYLLSNQIRAGGPSASPNGILNPPPEDW